MFSYRYSILQHDIVFILSHQKIKSGLVFHKTSINKYCTELVFKDLVREVYKRAMDPRNSFHLCYLLPGGFSGVCVCVCFNGRHEGLVNRHMAGMGKVTWRSSPRRWN